MTSEAERKAEHEAFLKIHGAFCAGDLAALRDALEDPSAVPNGVLSLSIGPCLTYAIYHSPLPFIRTLLELGADPNPDDHAGFPPLIAAISSESPALGKQTRTDVLAVLELLLEFGADPNQRGINDYTPLHMAVAARDEGAVELLLNAGASPFLRTRIDDCETPKEMAERAGLVGIVEVLTAHETRLQQ